MKTFNNDLFSTVNRLIGHLGPVTSLLDGIAERIAPKGAAQACSGVNCGLFCTTCCANCSGDYLSSAYYYYSYSTTGCATGDYTCSSYYGCIYC